MKKSVYFIIQALWSLILSAGIFYLALMSAFGPSGNKDSSLMGTILFVGIIIYIALTITHIVVGARKVKGWRWWFIPISLVIASGMGFIGEVLAVWVPELLNAV